MNENEQLQGKERGQTPETCGADLKDHIAQLVTLMMMSGMGGGCYDTYKTLLDVAEWTRRDKGWPVLTMNGDTTAEVVEELEKQVSQHEAQRVLAEYEQQSANHALPQGN